MTEHLSMKASQYSEQLKQFMSVDDGGFAQRYKRQILPLHVIAYYLLPETRANGISENFDKQLQVFFRQYTTDDVNYETLNFEFESFRAQETPFEYERRCWTLAKNPKLF